MQIAREVASACCLGVEVISKLARLSFCKLLMSKLWSLMSSCLLSLNKIFVLLCFRWQLLLEVVTYLVETHGILLLVWIDLRHTILGNVLIYFSFARIHKFIYLV